MPFGSEGVEEGIGLALSGGGFRATLFHVGALWRLNELGWFPRLDRVSSVSGGSIVAGLLAMVWDRLGFRDGVAQAFERTVAAPLLSFTRRNVDTPSILEGLFVPGKTVAEAVADRYRRHLFGDRGLRDLPDRPRFVFNATNLGTGANWRFQKPYCGDYRIGLIRHTDFPLATVVAASAAFPPVLSPVVLELAKEGLAERFERTEGADLYDCIGLRNQLCLADGGVYDNMGVESIWKRYRTLIISDAGGSPAMQFGPGRLWHNQLARAYALTIEQDRDLRRRVLYEAFKTGETLGTYWLISWPIDKFRAEKRLHVGARWPGRLASIRTRLNPFSEEEQRRLVNWGYALADAAVRRRVEDSGIPAAWPYPEYGLEAE
ncbi:MAG: patatin-like phospholipase family protein [Planctomycetes bacterium]|nr:patatin-like phospholipase family protein [Planctomycetota bacterium]